MLLLLFFNSRAQFNLQVGYGLGLVDLSNTKQLLQDYHSQNPWITSGFQDISYLNGVMVGVRQSWSIFSLGLNWKYRFADTKAEGIEPINNSVFTKELFISLQSYSLNLETGSGWIHLGTSLDFNKLSIKERHTGVNDKISLSNESQWGSQFYININFPASSSCQISLQPYYYMPWSGFSLGSLANYLGLHDPDRTAIKEPFRYFGISLVLSNGPQSGN